MKIIYNAEVISILLGYSVILTTCYSNGHRDSDICSHWNGRRHFLELGERGELHAFNVSAPAFRNALYAPLNISNRTNTDVWYQCNLELVTCAECVIRLTFTYANFSKQCENPNIAAGKLRSRCSCEHILFSEPPYDTDMSGQYFCGDGKVFRSRTRTLLLKFSYRATHRHIFSLQYYSERNVKIISGSPRQSVVSNYTQVAPQIISTPYFPVAYPRDYGIEYILTCEAENCHVRLEFTDFQLGLSSTMSIFDSNGQMLDSFTGVNFRPPILISSGKSLLLTFRGNNTPGLGFRAEISFITAKQLNQKETLPFTDCGGMVEGPGGAITMMNMIENTTEVRFYDCIWIIKPLNNYMMMKTHISLRVDALYGMASKSELLVRQGITSIAPEIERVTWPNKGLSKRNHIVPIVNGFYLRLRGVFGLSSRLAIVYSVFNYMNCYIGSEFLCQNNHCISIRLHCDGFDHCGDNSDEPGTCEDEWAHINGDRRWYTHKPNYYFPKIEQYPDLKTATGVFVMSTLGILLVLSGWMILLYRMGIRARNQRELQNHLQTISELLDRQEEIPIDDPPDYEAPPDYEEVIKIGMDDEMHTPHRRRRRRGRRHHTGRSRSGSHESSNPNQLGIPSPSTSEIRRQSENLQEIANRVLSATGMCEPTETSTAKQKQPKRKSNNDKNGQISSNSPVSPGSELSSTLQQQNSSYSLRTSTPLEENSAEFKDGSFNMSLSLALSQTPLTESTTNPKCFPAQQHTVYTENGFLKKSWVFFRSDCTPIERKLRHTYSTPETLLTDGLLHREMNYGSYLNSERTSFLSNASTFGSDLSSDGLLESPIAQNDTLINTLESPPNDKSSQGNAAKEGSPNVNNDKNTNLDISCFGNVNHVLRGGKRQSQRRNGRSKSFNQTDCHHKTRLKRCSSADLLLAICPRRES